MATTPPRPTEAASLACSAAAGSREMLKLQANEVKYQPLPSSLRVRALETCLERTHAASRYPNPRLCVVVVCVVCSSIIIVTGVTIHTGLTLSRYKKFVFTTRLAGF
eukprot:scaffold92634_cov56-Phaeocystis_antarctica.AAC.1